MMKLRPKLLLVEDNPLLRWWMNSTLEQEGFRVTALDSLDAFHRLDSAAPFDVLVTDWRLNDGHTGLDVLRLARGRYPEIVAVLVSAEASPQFADQARASGFDLVLEKPVPSAEIIAAVFQVAGKHAAGAAP